MPKNKEIKSEQSNLERNQTSMLFHCTDFAINKAKSADIEPSTKKKTKVYGKNQTFSQNPDWDSQDMH